MLHSPLSTHTAPFTAVMILGMQELKNKAKPGEPTPQKPDATVIYSTAMEKTPNAPSTLGDFTVNKLAKIKPPSMNLMCMTRRAGKAAQGEVVVHNPSAGSVTRVCLIDADQTIYTCFIRAHTIIHR